FNIQAELIVYGATEPDAQVTVGGNKIALRPDGTFTLRFSLPDGIYDVIARAVSKDGSDRRTVSLEFSRKTKSLEGEVGECKPPQKLPPPEIKK
ncbi:MAG TPA: Rho termination protein, partial [Verrucomicrobiota bacterium]|nr:Rho termination protein [Verrucomicrobiota bacterium]